MFKYPNAESIPLGIVMRRTPGVTRWVKWAWKALDILPGAGPADWKLLRSEGETTDYHAATKPLTLYVSDTEAYVHELGSREPSVYIILRPDLSKGDLPLDVVMVTASPYEAQDYEDSGEEVVEKALMPEGMRAWVVDFVRRHHVEEAFIKRRRDKARVDRVDAGIGDARIAQATDVYRSPAKKAVLQ